MIKKLIGSFILVSLSYSSFACDVESGKTIYIIGERGPFKVSGVNGNCDVIAIAIDNHKKTRANYETYAIAEGCVSNNQYCVGDRVESGKGFGNKADVVLAIFPDDGIAVEVVSVKNGFEAGKTMKINPSELFN